MSENGYRHVVCCIEHQSSAASQVALASARRVRAMSGEGRLTLVHVMEPMIVYPTLPATGVQTWVPDPEEFRDAAEQWLRDMGREGEDLAILEGYPPAAVCAWAEDNGVDLIVAASSRGAFERVLLGSFATYLARHAPCEVLLVRPVAEA